MESEKRYKLAVVLGRFQPIHTGHEQLIRKASEIADHVLIIVGSANKSKNVKNPFSYMDRWYMLDETFKDLVASYRLTISPANDMPYNNDRWFAHIQEIVARNSFEISNEDIVLVGGNKDAETWYLRAFPQWDFKSFLFLPVIHATDIRTSLFKENALWALSVPENTRKWIVKYYLKSEDFRNHKEEYQDVTKYKEMWKVAPYPPTFVTTDAVVICNGHFLAIKRKFNPGKGKWALPGGFLDQAETIEACALRELKEETSIEVPKNALRSRIIDQSVFDAPDRSLRGRTITHAFLIRLNDRELPVVNADSDADEVKWLPLSFVDEHPEEMFEDHSDIINFFTFRN